MLERVVAALAARVDLPVDRLADAQIVSGAVAAAATRHLGDGELRLELEGEPGAVIPCGSARCPREPRRAWWRRPPSPASARSSSGWSTTGASSPADDGQESLRLAIAAAHRLALLSEDGP